MKVKEKATRLLQANELGPVMSVKQLTGGRNNSVHLINTSTQNLVLKIFFHNKLDTRDRFTAETSFYAHCKSLNITSVPRLFAASREDQMLLLDFIVGRKLETSEISKISLIKALNFLIEINSQSSLRSKIPTASEGGFSLKKHIEMIEIRLGRLEKFVIDEAACDFIHTKLRPLWNRLIRPIARHKIYNSGHTERCISPSDFGFHNCLAQPDGNLIFYDFEYAGWDDPAKLICDFFCQVEIPVPFIFLEFAIETLNFLAKEKRDFSERTMLLLPAIKIKWCCLLLNEFLSSEEKRRRFAEQLNSPQRLTTQLRKANAVLDDARRLAEAH
tara:strand:- start:2066 stop:3055 length:990 start_codon:yes stop_codon:yes gene_type:complete